MSTLFSHFFTKINQISPLETNFTEVLESIALKPETLYFYGKIPGNMAEMDNIKNIKQHKIIGKSSNESRTNIRPERPKTVAIVGSRHNTKYGEEIAYKMSYELAKNGVIIVSGLAYGIDSIAHRACLDAGGKTVAVLGTPIDHIYPTRNKPLAKEIIEKDGAIISEYAPGAKILPKISFLERNRIISGLSDIVVVVEAAERSGSLNTASHALEQGKEVFSVPGNITNPYSIGCNKLICQGAIPYNEPDDILRLLFPDRYAKKHKKSRQTLLFGDTETETCILRALSNGLRDGEDIMKETRISATEFNQNITLLEIKGLVRPLGANKWSLN